MLKERIDAADRAARDACVQHAADMARVEGQRDELSDLLRDKTEELAAATERIEKVERELQSATDTIERLREEVAMRNTDPLHVQVRHGNAYDALLDQAVKNSGNQNALVELYRNIETHTSNMRWQTFLNETALNVRNLLSVFMRYDLSKKLSEKAMVEKNVGRDREATTTPDRIRAKALGIQGKQEEETDKGADANIAGTITKCLAATGQRLGRRNEKESVKRSRVLLINKSQVEPCKYRCEARVLIPLSGVYSLRSSCGKSTISNVHSHATGKTLGHEAVRRKTRTESRKLP